MNNKNVLCAFLISLNSTPVVDIAKEASPNTTTSNMNQAADPSTQTFTNRREYSKYKRIEADDLLLQLAMMVNFVFLAPLIGFTASWYTDPCTNGWWQNFALYLAGSPHPTLDLWHPWFAQAQMQSNMTNTTVHRNGPETCLQLFFDNQTVWMEQTYKGKGYRGKEGVFFHTYNGMPTPGISELFGLNLFTLFTIMNTVFIFSRLMFFLLYNHQEIYDGLKNNTKAFANKILAGAKSSALLIKNLVTPNNFFIANDRSLPSAIRTQARNRYLTNAVMGTAGLVTFVKVISPLVFIFTLKRVFDSWDKAGMCHFKANIGFIEAYEYGSMVPQTGWMNLYDFIEEDLSYVYIPYMNHLVYSAIAALMHHLPSFYPSKQANQQALLLWEEKAHRVLDGVSTTFTTQVDLDGKKVAPPMMLNHPDITARLMEVGMSKAVSMLQEFYGADQGLKIHEDNREILFQYVEDEIMSLAAKFRQEWANKNPLAYHFYSNRHMKAQSHADEVTEYGDKELEHYSKALADHVVTKSMRHFNALSCNSSGDFEAFKARWNAKAQAGCAHVPILDEKFIFHPSCAAFIESKIWRANTPVPAGFIHENALVTMDDLYSIISELINMCELDASSTHFFIQVKKALSLNSNVLFYSSAVLRQKMFSIIHALYNQSAWYTRTELKTSTLPAFFSFLQPTVCETYVNSSAPISNVATGLSLSCETQINILNLMKQLQETMQYEVIPVVVGAVSNPKP